MRARHTIAALLLLLCSFPALAGTRMIFPRIVFQQGRFSGIAISNPTGTEAPIRLNAYNLDGTPFAGDGVRNGVDDTIAAGGQYLRLASQVFNPPPPILGGSVPTYLWVEVTSDREGLTGFFLEGDSAITFQYGGELGTFGTDLFLPAVENSGSTVTEISLVNADTAEANITVDFLQVDGTKALESQSKKVPQHGAIQGPLASIFTAVSDKVASLRIHSDRPVVCYGVIRPQSGKTPIALPAEDATVPAKTLYFPQLAEGNGWTTSLGIINLNSTDSALVTITAYQADGTLFADPGITNPVTQQIQPGAFFRSSIRSLFPFSDTSYKEGWIKVDATFPAINGFVEYGSGNNRALVTAQLNSYQLSMFSHQAMASPYFTGLAILNPGSLATNVEVFSLDNKGNTWGRAERVLRPGERDSQLLYQWVSEAGGKTGGSVFVRSDRPVIATELFAREDVTALANVPPQRVTTNFNPNSPTPKIAPVPPLAVVETGKSQQFQAPGASGLAWYVNGKKGGDDSVGTISDTGLYKAPNKAPSPRTVTIEAASGNSAGGSSIDVVQREQLTGGLTLVTSVAYMENLKRFFVAEQQVLSSAPAAVIAAMVTNANISEVFPDGSSRLFLSIGNDTISKMLPFVSSGSSYLILAGHDSGKIYRLDIAGQKLATVISGLNQPNSLALDPFTGNLLVAESGAGRVTVVPRSQILSAADPSVPLQAATVTGRIISFSVPSVQGIAVDDCTGTVYATVADGTLHEFQGSIDRVVESDLNNPKQLVALYREGFSCSDALSLAIVEDARISLVYPKTTLSRTTLVDNLPPVLDITFFPRGNPFTSGGEASLGLAEPSSTPGLGQISQIQVGGLYQSAPPLTVTLSGLFSGTGPNEDPEGDTFTTGASAQYGYTVPDILSVTGSVEAGLSVITIKFKDPVTLGTLPTTGPNPPGDGLWAIVFIKTANGGTVSLPQGIDLGSFFPFGDPGQLTFDTYIELYFGQASWVSLTQLSAGAVQVSAVGNTLTLSVPASALDLSGASAIVLVGDPVEFTDVAPNNGLLRLAP